MIMIYTSYYQIVSDEFLYKISKKKSDHLKNDAFKKENVGNFRT